MERPDIEYSRILREQLRFREFAITNLLRKILDVFRNLSKLNDARQRDIGDYDNDAWV